VPFREALKANPDSVMLAQASVPARRSGRRDRSCHLEEGRRWPAV
jgi:hypothetical protein